MPTIDGISWFMLFYEKCNGPLVGTYNIWSEVSLKFLVVKELDCKNLNFPTLHWLEAKGKGQSKAAPKM